MTTYVALLRAVNVGGTGKLPMAALRALCAEIGFADVRTYIASGNVVFESDVGAGAVKADLETRLATYAGKPVGVVVRTGDEIADILAGYPFALHEPKHSYVVFLDAAPPAGALKAVKGRDGEEMALGSREIFVAYPNGMGQSKLTIPAAKAGTARNLNTVRALGEMAGCVP